MAQEATELDDTSVETADDSWSSATATVAPSREAWIGAESTANVWSLYSGLTWAPLGSVREDGWRVRMVGGYGQYKFDPTSHGASAFGEIFGGYHWTLGALTLKAFVGATFEGAVSADLANPFLDRLVGGKGVIEAWQNLGELDWAAVDLAWSSTHESIHARLRLGHRVTSSLSLGVEAAAFSSTAGETVRGGGLARYEWDAGEVSISGGALRDQIHPATPYATVVYLSRF